MSTVEFHSTRFCYQAISLGASANNKKNEWKYCGNIEKGALRRNKGGEGLYYRISLACARSWVSGSTGNNADKDRTRQSNLIQAGCLFEILVSHKKGN